MATVTKTNARKLPDPAFGGVPYGNAVKLHYSLTTDSSGVMTASDQATAIGIADKVILGVLPAGLEIQDALTIISDVGQAASTADIGFEYADGVDSVAVPEDADYFYATLDLATAGRTRATNTAVAPVILPKDAYLTLLNNTAAQDEVMQVDIIVEGVLRGND